MKQLEKIIDVVKSKLNGDRKKLIENCAIVIIIGVILIIAGGAFLDKEDKEKGSVAEKTKTSEVTNSQSEASVPKSELENQLKTILSQIAGAGRVDVMITFVSGKEIVPAYDSKTSENKTEEKDSGGGTRSISQNSNENGIAYEEAQDGAKKPIIIKELLPEVKGVVIVADGASNPEICEALAKAARTLLDVPIHKIGVFERKK